MRGRVHSYLMFINAKALFDPLVRLVKQVFNNSSTSVTRVKYEMTAYLLNHMFSE